MAKRKKVLSVKISARVPADVWLMVESLAAATKMSEGWALQVLLRTADRALAGDSAAVKSCAAAIAKARTATKDLVKLEGHAKTHAQVVRMAMAAACGAPPPKPVPPELVS